VSGGETTKNSVLAHGLNHGDGEKHTRKLCQWRGKFWENARGQRLTGAQVEHGCQGRRRNQNGVRRVDQGEGLRAVRQEGKGVGRTGDEPANAVRKGGEDQDPLKKKKEGDFRNGRWENS